MLEEGGVVVWVAVLYSVEEVISSRDRGAVPSHCDGVSSGLGFEHTKVVAGRGRSCIFKIKSKQFLVYHGGGGGGGGGGAHMMWAYQFIAQWCWEEEGGREGGRGRKEREGKGSREVRGGQA